MAKTVSSGSASYCTVAQFLAFFDSRTVGDLVSDSGSRVTAAQLTSNTTLGLLLQQASGELEAAALIGNRYTSADLVALAATNSGIFLASVVAGLAFRNLIRRRPDMEIATPPQVEEAEKCLQALSMGERIFGFQETMDSGETQEDTETSYDVDRRKMVSWHSQRYFGRRANRYDVA